MYVRKRGSQMVAFMPELHRSRVLGLPPRPSHFSHPIEQPSENQRHDWPTSHESVPFAQLQLQG